MTTALLRASSLRRAYDGRTVLDIDALDVRRGEILAVLGANGSGKSTLFRVLMRLERPDAGEVSFTGQRMSGVFQKPFLFSGTVRENIAFGLNRRSDRAERAAAAADVFGLGGLMHTSVHTLSGGEAQRVALARAVATRPDVLFLDEPTANLDVLIKKSFRTDIERAARAHAGAVVLITHDPAEAFALADRIAVLDKGRIVQTGTPEELLENPRTHFVASFGGAELLLDGVVAAVADGLVHVDVGDAMVWAVVPADHEWTPVVGMGVHVSYRPEDVMISVPDSGFETSARNQYRLRIATLHGSAGLVRLRLDGVMQLNALVTRTSAESLGLRAGMEVVAHMKATALRASRHI